MYKWKGSYTVEAVFVMTISIFVIMSIFYAAMFTYDKALVLSETHYRVDMCLSKAEEDEMKEVEGGIIKSLQGKLFLIRVHNISTKKQIVKTKIIIKYTLSLSIPLLKQALTEGGRNTVFELEHSYIRPAGWMWDASILKGEGG